MNGKAVDYEAVRAIGAAIPDVKLSAGKQGLALKLKGKLLACEAIHRSAEPGSLMVRISNERRRALLAKDVRTYYLTDHYAPYSAILLRLSRINRTALKDLLIESSEFVRNEGGSAGRRRARCPTASNDDGSSPPC